MSYAKRIIETFGGVRAMAKRLGRSPSTVGSWGERGSIPDAEKALILSCAIADGLPIGPSDFFPFEHMPEPSPPPEKKDAA